MKKPPFIPFHTSMQKALNARGHARRWPTYQRHGTLALLRFVRVNCVTGAAIRTVNEALPADGTPWTDAGVNPIFGFQGPDYRDVAQWGIQDCYFLADLMALAVTEKGREYLTTILQPAVSVTGLAVAHRWWVFFRRDGVVTRVEVECKVAAQQGSITPLTPLWWFLLEQAYAFFRSGANTLQSLNYGRASQAATDLGLMLAESPMPALGIQQCLDRGQLVVLNSGSWVPPWMPPNHCEPCIASDGFKVQLANPWGVNASPPAATPILRFPTFTDADTMTYWWNFTAIDTPAIPDDLPIPAPYPHRPPPVQSMVA